jgi:hypothetical protein
MELSMPTPLSRNFTLEELTFSQTAARQGINNVPDERQILALRALCANILQPLRDAIDLPIMVTSGFRCPALNRAVDGAADSQHMKAEAADIICPAIAPEALLKHVLNLHLPFDQLIYEGGRGSVWIHVSFNVLKPRGEILSATFPPGGGILYSPLSPDEALALNA